MTASAPPPPPAPPAVRTSARGRFEARLPGLLVALDAALDDLRQQGGPGALEHARLLAHRLRGAAPTFGFLTVGEAAGRIEDALVAGGLGEDAWDEIASDLDEIRDHVTVTTSGERPALQTGPVPRHAPTRVLLLDDSPIVLEALAGYARRQMLRVLCARSTAEALHLSRKKPPDLAIVDMRLGPPDDGISAADALRALPGLARLPIAFMSADAELASHVAAANAGAALFLVKPLEEGSFAAAIRELEARRPLEAPRVVILDDDPDFSAWVDEILRPHAIEVTRLDRAGDIPELLRGAPPDALLLDVLMPSISGIDVCRMVRTTPGWQDVPVLFLSGAPTVRDLAFEAGADDFLIKPFEAADLRVRIKIRVERARLQRERTDRDPVTGLWLRRPLLELLRARLADAGRQDQPLSLALIDLDRLKQINDQGGHLAGDHVLAVLGRLLQSRFRAGDLRGRWGGDEFLVAFPGQPRDTMRMVLERTQAELSATSLLRLGLRLRPSFSAGIASFPDEGHTVDELLACADRRLYLAKAQRGRVLVDG